ncbi:MAG: HEPN domain-containing protein [Armatimonadetes bacterium]|nr:HEPN domain-containing protein [Armatimonadota bacterium]NIM23688.1 HEPN domain-containing protein [Armatimonadota bacterium]NIM67562.1 HEPN domain-containing protein [Armatimonadota bacterium]NIM76075.1 HEPN domain-containing protein [Armatimonadota bacterium]NIN05746.1 HEPN domain-containing protein [Armatimonadota bacterium]
MESLHDQIGRWLRQAEHDLETARKLVDFGAFDHAAFLAQQAAEKSLKALWMSKQKRISPRTHDLVRLAMELAAPPEIIEAARMMAGDYMATRYPDVGDDIPAKTYTAEDADRRVAAAAQVCGWVKDGFS